MYGDGKGHLNGALFLFKSFLLLTQLLFLSPLANLL
jgi:hypothetical protein